MPVPVFKRVRSGGWTPSNSLYRAGQPGEADAVDSGNPPAESWPPARGSGGGDTESRFTATAARETTR